MGLSVANPSYVYRRHEAANHRYTIRTSLVHTCSRDIERDHRARVTVSRVSRCAIGSCYRCYRFLPVSWLLQVFISSLLPRIPLMLPYVYVCFFYSMLRNFENGIHLIYLAKCANCKIINYYFALLCL